MLWRTVLIRDFERATPTSVLNNNNINKNNKNKNNNNNNNNDDNNNNTNYASFGDI